MQRPVGDALGQVLAQVPVADRLAGGQLTVAKHEVRLALAHPLELTTERFEKCRGPHDGVVQPAGQELALESQLGLLKGQQRLLHAQRRQQHHMLHARLLGCFERVRVRLVIDGPGVCGSAGA
jgi:hypothetical protein